MFAEALYEKLSAALEGLRVDTDVIRQRRLIAINCPKTGDITYYLDWNTPNQLKVLKIEYAETLELNRSHA